MLKHEEHLPFKQKPEQTARYIVDHVFKGEKVINPSWLYNLMTHLVNILPDSLILKALGPVQPTAL
jgi:short-subunit dehydrogenase